MYVVMKDGTYFTGAVVQNRQVDLLWTRHIAGAKVWQAKRAWAQQAAARWGGEVAEIQETALARRRSLVRPRR